MYNVVPLTFFFMLSYNLEIQFILFYTRESQTCQKAGTESYGYLLSILHSFIEEGIMYPSIRRYEGEMFQIDVKRQ